MEQSLQRKINQWKSLQLLEDEPQLSRRELADYAVDTAVKAFRPMLIELALDAKQARADNLRLRKEIATLQEELTATKQVATKPSFPRSQKLQKMQDELDDLAAETKRLELSEFSEYRRLTIETIGRRNQKAVKENEYAKALKSDYSTAQSAINARKADIQRNGVTITEDYSGTTCKAEYDQETSSIFTFSLLSQPDFEMFGVQYQILKAEISLINAGNRYWVTPTR